MQTVQKKSASRPRQSRRALAGKSVSATMQRVQAPPQATIPADADKELRAEQDVSRVELCMLRGVTKPGIIGAMLGLPTRTVMRYQERVEARWTITGGGRNIPRYRGEALARLDLVESEAWAAYGSIDNQRDPSVRDRVKVLSLIASLQDQRSALLGLSPKVVEKIALMPADQNAEVLARFAAQRDLAAMATRLSQILAERRAALSSDAIEHESDED